MSVSACFHLLPADLPSSSGRVGGSGAGETEGRLKKNEKSRKKAEKREAEG